MNSNGRVSKRGGKNIVLFQASGFKTSSVSDNYNIYACRSTFDSVVTCRMTEGFLSYHVQLVCELNSRPHLFKDWIIDGSLFRGTLSVGPTVRTTQTRSRHLGSLHSRGVFPLQYSWTSHSTHKFLFAEECST